MRTVAVVLAGGSGLRLGGDTPKQLRLLAGRTLVEHCVAAFDRAPGIDEIIVVMPAELVGEAERILGSRYRKVESIIAGGADRPGSTRRAIDLLSARHRDCDVLFHDAARPLVDQRIIADCVSALSHCQALGVVAPTADTIATISGGAMTSIPPRDSLGRCQTPQGFRLSVIRRAHELAAADPRGLSATDDCGVVLRYLPDVQVRVVPGSEHNMKITYPADLRLAEALLADQADQAQLRAGSEQTPTERCRSPRRQNGSAGRVPSRFQQVLTREGRWRSLPGRAAIIDQSRVQPDRDERRRRHGQLADASR